MRKNGSKKDWRRKFVPNGSRKSSDRLVDILKLGADYLERYGIDDARLTAEHLLGDGLCLNRVGLYMNYDRPLTEPEKQLFRERLKRRIAGEPEQYILGYAYFRELKLAVRPGVLIPRPETELLVDLAQKAMPEGGWKRVLEVGPGSGAISLSLLGEKMAKHVVAADVSPDAVQITIENARSLGFEPTSEMLPQNGDKEIDFAARITTLVKPGEGQSEAQRLDIVLADAFSRAWKPSFAPFDLVVSNPPYVTEEEYRSLAAEVHDFEPVLALVSGEDGLNAHRALAEAMPRWLQKGGYFIGEIGYRQGEAARNVHRLWTDVVSVQKDLEGNDRFVDGWLKR